MDEVVVTPKQEPMPLSLEELKQELADLENGSFVSLTDSELRERIRLIHAAFILKAPTYPVGTLIYRAVRISERPSHRARISYPPVNLIRANGRLNRVGEGMFYGSLNQFASCLQECAWKVGEFFAISAWITTERMTFNHLGYSSAVLKAHKSNRELPFFIVSDDPSERNTLIREWQARVFTQQVSPGNEHLYRLPIALKDFALGKMVQTDPKQPDLFSGVIYPSMAMHLLGDNVAILPREVDRKMALIEVILLTLNAIRVNHKDDGSIETGMEMKMYDYARPDAEGNLVWGQKSQIVYPDGVDHSKYTLQVLPPV